jgi:trimethylamine:corrinoid methyltransferase-like protein
MREDWEAAGSKDAYQRSHERMIEILEKYEPPQLSADVLKKVRSIVVEAEEELEIYDGDKKG